MGRQPAGARVELLLLALACLVLALLYPQWRGGLALLWLSFAIVARSEALRRPPWLAALVAAALLLRFGVAAGNAWLGPLPGAEMDALNFHETASLPLLGEGYRFGMDHILFSQLLGILYFVGGDSLFTGSAASVFMFVLSCLVLSRLLDLLDIDRGRLLIFALFALWPSQVLLQSVTLRESWLVLLLLLACYNGLRYVDSGRWSRLLLLFASLVAAALIHRVHVYSGSLLLVMFLLAAQFTRTATAASPRRRLLQGTVVVAAAALLLVALSFTHSGQRLVYENLQRDLVVTVEHYRNALLAEQPRSDFGVRFDGSSPVAILSSFALIYTYYLFAPFLHMVETALDLVAAGEALLRMALVVLTLAALWFARAERRRNFLLLFAAWLIMTLIWASGTVCYGQAIRHHVLTNWVVIVLGVAALAMLAGRRSRPPASSSPVLE